MLVKNLWPYKELRERMINEYDSKIMAEEVVRKDLEYICHNLKEEFTLMSGARVLITGGAGFLGYYLLKSALNWNASVAKASRIHITIYDNFIRGMPDWLVSLNSDADLKIVKHDITSPLPNDVCDFDYIIHAASIASPTFYRKFPIETMDANVSGLRYLLDYCLTQKNAGKEIKGLLYFSTSEIYGDPTPDNIPTSETYRGNVSCTGPRACYDESKRFGEALCVNFAQQHHLPIKIARPFNNYGPGLKITDRRVLPDFVRDVLNGKNIELLSDGGPTRTFCYIADAIIGYYKVLLKGRPGEAYNIGVEDPEISMLELAKRVIHISNDIYGYKGEVVFKSSNEKDYLVDNPNRRCPVILKANTELGFFPRISIDDGLRRSIIWYGSNNKAEEK